MKTTKIIISALIICMPWISSAQGIIKFENRVQKMSKETNPQKNVIELQSIISDYNLDPIKNAEELDVLHGTVALSYLASGNYPMFEQYIKAIKNKFNQTSYMNMGTYDLLTRKIDFDYALSLAKKTVDLYESYIDDKAARPISIPEEAWERWIKMAAYPYYETYASALYLNHEAQKALMYEEKALQGKKSEEIMQSSLELYAELLISQGRTEKAYDILIDRVNIGNSSLKMNDLLKQLLIIRTGSLDRSTAILDSIQSNTSVNYKDKLLKESVKDELAPNFILSDVNGKEISLDDLKGKVVVLDFWATWCAPCIASMPAMKKVSSKHPDVVFIFIATQEQGKDPLSRIRAYLKKNGFPLNVLIDTPSKTNSDLFSTANLYRINALPTKFVIDKNGKIRFISSGFSSDTELINELEAMISITKLY